MGAEIFMIIKTETTPISMRVELSAAGMATSYKNTQGLL